MQQKKDEKNPYKRFFRGSRRVNYTSTSFEQFCKNAFGCLVCSFPSSLIFIFVPYFGATFSRFCPNDTLARKIHDFRSAKGLAMVQNRCLRGFETKSEAFA
jgi:hypothetical protein